MVAVRGVVGVAPADVAGDLRLDLRALEVAALQQAHAQLPVHRTHHLQRVDLSRIRVSHLEGTCKRSGSQNTLYLVYASLAAKGHYNGRSECRPSRP